MEILSCNQYDAETASWAAASIYELAVYGEGESGDSDETTEIPIQTASAGTKATPRSWTAPGSLADGCSVPPLR